MAIYIYIYNVIRSFLPPYSTYPCLAIYISDSILILCKSPFFFIVLEVFTCLICSENCAQSDFIYSTKYLHADLHQKSEATCVYWFCWPLRCLGCEMKLDVWLKTVKDKSFIRNVRKGSGVTIACLLMSWAPHVCRSMFPAWTGFIFFPIHSVFLNATLPPSGRIKVMTNPHIYRNRERNKCQVQAVLKGP